MSKKELDGTPINCHCGKLIAIAKDGKILVLCKRCKRQVDVLDIKHRAKSH